MQRRSLLPSAFGGFTTPSPRHGSDPFLALHREMNRLFDEALRGFGLPEGGAGSEAIASGAEGTPHPTDAVLAGGTIPPAALATMMRAVPATIDSTKALSYCA